MSTADRLLRITHGLALTLALALAVCGYLHFAWTGELVSLGGDSATYLLTAQAFAGVNTAVSAHFAAASFYPPLYPLVLAAFGGAHSMLAANLVTTGLLLLTLPVLYAFARLAGLAAWTALAVVVVFAAAPGSYLQTVMAQSENLYLLTSISALAGAAAYERSGRAWQLAALALFVALATLTRSAGVALLVALVVHGLLARRVAVIAAALVAAMPVLAWGWLHPGEHGYAAQLALPQGPAGWAAFAGSQLSTWIRLWPSNFGVSQFAVGLLWLITLLGVAGAVRRAVARRFDGLYSCAYLGICLLWPFPIEAQRLLFVIEPVLLVQAFLLVQGWAQALAQRTTPHLAVAPALVATLLLLGMMPGLALAIDRYRQTPAALESYRHRPEWYAGHFGPEDFAARDQLVQAMRDVATRADVAADDCVYAAKPSLVAFHSGHLSRLPPPESFDDAAFRSAVAAQPCRYLLLMGSTPTYPTYFYPYGRVEDEVEIVALYSLPRADGSQRQVAALARWRDHAP